MKRWTLCVAVLAMGMTGLALQAGDDHGAGDGHGHSNLPLCPVMGEPIDFSVGMDTDDGPLYVCCKGCFKKLKAKPAKYAAKVAAQRAAVAKMPKVQVTCPVSGNPIKTDVFAMVDGKKIYACCNNCVGKLEASPESFATQIAASFTHQTKCPVSGNDIDAATSMTVGKGAKSGNVYFCCGGCVDKFKANPEKFSHSLEEQGYATLARMASAK